MLKADRDQIMEDLADEDRKQFRQFIDDYRAKRKAASGSQMPAREMLWTLWAETSPASCARPWKQWRSGTRWAPMWATSPLIST